MKNNNQYDEKLAVLIKNIHKLKYNILCMEDMNKFQTLLSKDLDTDVSNALKILEFALDHEYVFIDSNYGICVNPSSKEVKKFISVKI